MRREEKTHVLVVDDEPALRELLVDALSSDGKLVIESAGSGKEAMDLARRKKPDKNTRLGRVVFLGKKNHDENENRHPCP